MFLRRLLLLLITGVLVFAAGAHAGFNAVPLPLTPTGAQALVPPLPIPPLAEIAPTGDVAEVVAYWNANADPLTALFADEARAKALFAMYIVHVAVPYGETTPPPYTFAEYTGRDRAHCGVYTFVQREISQALGLTVRGYEFTDGFHGWLEVEINGAWELFDSTGNIWINQPMSALLAGAPREYRMFYAPALDDDAPAVYHAHLSEGYNVPAFRARLPFLGLEPGVTFPAFQPLTES